MYIPRHQLTTIEQLLRPNKVVVIYGPRRSGKTTLVKKFLEGREQPYLLVSGEDDSVQRTLSSRSIPKLRDFVGKTKLLVIDEAQRIDQVGLNLKLIVDHLEGVSVLATGSSSFDLARDVGEPLTGRRFVLTLYPLAQLEIGQAEPRHETEANLESRLIYGSFPEVAVSHDNREREAVLLEMASSSLFKDIFALEGIRHSNKLMRLLRLLAFQIGHEVSYNELGTQLGMSKNTVDRYLDLLEKAFVIRRIPGFSRNLRKEVSKNPRYCFLDNGIRNAVIRNFNSLDMRDDVGMLWENYIVMERLKAQECLQIPANNYFWRTYDRKEIDWIEERGGKLHGYEIKWSQTQAKRPQEWLDSYKNASYSLIHRGNYLDFVTGPGTK